MGEARYWQAMVLSAVILCGAAAAQSQNALPEGNGKAIVEEKCVMCHELEQVIGSRFTRADWQTTMNRMKDYGVELTDDEWAVVTDYLATNYEGTDRPTGAVIAGDVEVTIREWTVPTAGSRPHDPLVAPDGSIWYTGQMANIMGRFDPETEQFQEFHLETPNSRPHGLVADKEGNIWFTAQGAGYVGKLDPNTGNVTEYMTPDPDRQDPHTPIIDHDGTVWFTMQRASMIGRVDPGTGEVQVVPTPTPRANPYGMVVSSKNEVWFCEFRQNKLAKIDKDMNITEYTLPNPATRPRRIAITPDDRIWYGDYPRGYLGVFDPETGETKEWLSPSGANARPYGIVAVGNIIWYSESGVQKNTLVRFDPTTERFQTWEIPSGGGVVRNMWASPEGDVWMATSGVNGIAVAEVQN